MNFHHTRGTKKFWELLKKIYLKYSINLVNKTNLVHNLLLVYLSISTCFGQLWAHRKEKQLCSCDTWYLLFCVDDCLVCRVHVEIDKYTKNKLCTKLVLFTRLYRDVWSKNIK
jgi:hypothetical protein